MVAGGGGANLKHITERASFNFLSLYLHVTYQRFSNSLDNMRSAVLIFGGTFDTSLESINFLIKYQYNNFFIQNDFTLNYSIFII